MFRDLEAGATGGDGQGVNQQQLSSRNLSVFVASFVKIMMFEIPLYFLADNTTLENLRKSFVSERYAPGHVDDVKCHAP